MGALAFGVFAKEAPAQGSCSVPQLGPGSPAGSSALTQAPGSGWFQVTWFHLDTHQEFNAQAQRNSYFAQGHVVLSSLLATAAVGIVRGVEAWAHLPVHRVRFDEVSGGRQSTGVGDPRFSVRVGPDLFGVSTARLPVAFAVRAGVKFPGSEFPIDQQIIPLTEGQRDYEIELDFSKSFAPTPLYLTAWAGYRWREEIAGRPQRPARPAALSRQD